MLKTAVGQSGVVRSLCHQRLRTPARITCWVTNALVATYCGEKQTAVSGAATAVSRMMILKVLGAVLFALPAFGQLQLFQVEGVKETPVASVYQVPAAAPGDSLETRFRVRNQGTGAIALQSLSLSGTGIKIVTASAPSLPYTIAPAAFVDFRFVFSPDTLGSYSASLQVNNISVLIRGSAVAAVTVKFAGSPLSSGATADFGKLERGVSLQQTFSLTNFSNAPLTVSSIVISGTAFQGPSGITAPVTLSTGQSVPFQITFTPQTATAFSGTLTIDGRSFNLTGMGLDPPLPSASFILDSATASSSQQLKLKVVLAATSKVNGTGTLTLEFRPSVTTVLDDPAIQFLSGPKRQATVTVVSGEAIGRFGSSLEMVFQTGTTAGTILFTLKLPNSTVQQSLVVAPAAPGIDIANGTRRVSDLDINLTGFDNTRSASRLAFTFYDKNGKVLAPGAVTADISKDFKSFFGSSPAGGAFALRATFPVSGDPTVVVGADVEMTNAAGVTKTQRITF